MASSVSTLNNYSNFPLFSYGDLSLLTAGMSAMQGKIDTNRQKLDQMADVLSSEIYNSMSREGDKEHFRQRLNQGLEVINKYASGDLSDDQLMKQLSNKMNEIVDTRVMNAVSSTATRRVEEQKWDWYKENEPDKYSEKNRILRSKQWSSYANSQDPNAKYVGGGDFAEYVDPYKVLMSEDFAKSLKDLGINGKWVQQANGGLYFDYIDEKEGTRPENAQKLAQAVQGALGQKGMTQLALNAEWEYGDVYNPDNVNRLREDYNNYYSSKAKTRGEDKEIMEKMLASATPEEKQMLQQRIKSLESEVSQYASKNFDADVVGDNGVIDINKYNNIYTSLGVNSQLESLIGFAYQEPVTISRKVEDIKLSIAKHEEGIRQFEQEMALKLDKFELEKDEFALNLAKFELEKGKAASDGTVSATDFSTASSNIDLTTSENFGKQNLIKVTAQDQKDAVDLLQNVIGKNLSSSDRIALAEQLATTPVGDIKSITIGGQEIPITEDNKTSVMTALNNYNEVFVKGDSVTRSYRKAYEGVQKENRDNILTHYRNNKSEHTGLDANKDNFYFEKDSSGQVVYKEGRLDKTKSNYQHLMDKATSTEGGFYKNLTKEEQATLDMYFTKDAIQSKQSYMNDWEKRQYYETQKEKLYKQFGAKAVNTLKGFDQDSKTTRTRDKEGQTLKAQLPFATNVFSGQLPQRFVSGNGRVVKVREVSAEEAKNISTNLLIRGDKGEYTGKLYTPYSGSESSSISTTLQDKRIGNIGYTDGWNLGGTINKRFEDVRGNMEETVKSRVKGITTQTYTVNAKSASGKTIQNKLGVPMSDNAIITLTPVFKDNKDTGEYSVSYTVPAGSGKDSKPKTFDVPTKITDVDLGGVFNPSQTSVYNTQLGGRAGVINLGSSLKIVDNNPSNILNERPSDSFTNSVNALLETYKEFPNAVKFIEEVKGKYEQGLYSFEVKPLTEGGNYGIYMNDKTTGVSTPIHDLKMTTFNSTTDVAEIYKNQQQFKEAGVIESVLKASLKPIKL